jgi:hypothetical protein
VTTPTVSATTVNSVLFPVTFAQLQSDITACGSTNCEIDVNVNILVTANISFPSNITVRFAGSGELVQNAADLTTAFAGPVIAPCKQIFVEGATTTLGPLVTEAYPEWWGGVANGSTDDTGSFIDSIAALNQGCVSLADGTYIVSSTITIFKSSVGICGVGNGYANSASLGGTAGPVWVIESTSATADIIDVAGASATAPIAWNKFTNFALSRSVVPTAGTITPGSQLTGATGLSLNHAAGVTISGVHSSDFIRGFYLHNSPSFGTGIIEYSEANWEFLAVAGSSYASGTVVCGFCVDSFDGEAMDTQTLFSDNAATNNITGITSYGLLVSGSAINDFESDWMSTSLTSYGIYVDCTGTTSDFCQDNHFANSILDGSFISSAFVTGINTGGRGSVDFRGGWFTNTGAYPVSTSRAALV